MNDLELENRVRGCCLVEERERETNPREACVSLGRIWQVALQTSDWNDAERRHLENCSRCRIELNAVVFARKRREPQVTPAPMTRGATLRQPSLSVAMATAVADAPVVARAENDPGLTFVRYRDRCGEFLDLEHDEHPGWTPGTLLRLRITATASSAADIRFVVLTAGSIRPVARRLRLPQELSTGETRVEVEPITVSSLSDANAAELWDSFVASRKECPSAVSDWQSMARAGLAAESLETELRETLERIVVQEGVT